ncbi:Na(+) H(+) antiporter subunit D [Caenispirillum salinarum AK4]|uniref:Na(+) H(+) antiporter subunit D n=1 Tax=Caenispirillum salinarum AK4 TaxID=1238182 RepID=K9HC03_9PROT|nr:Na+/H+ antiporter subunit D [Caenispirillum salinarum]EKV28073.1 Na(+) H(+) antiporter subunit D [Caenispirillum salinarum AK4]
MSAAWLLFLPIALPFAGAVLAFIAGRAGDRRAPQWVNVGTTALMTLVSLLLLSAVWRDGPQAIQMGGWAAPFGITLVADILGAVMVVITALSGLAVAVYAMADIDEGRAKLGWHALYLVLLAGVTGAFLTGDLFNLYVWFEVMLIASFCLLVLGGDKAQLDGGLRYVALNLVATVMFLMAIGLLYGLTGTLNMADLHVTLKTVDAPGLVTTIAVLFLGAFGIKSAVFPLFFWLPASYHVPPVAVSAIFAALLTKVGVYALIRLFTLVFTADVDYTHGILLVIAGATMVTGVLGAAAQNQVRKILSFHIISQIGYMVMGLALYTPLALLGAVFYLVHHIIVKANLFLVGGVAKRITGSFELDRIGGLYKAKPWLAVLFLIPALSLAGIPPLSGFWAKLVLIEASLEVEAWVIAGVALVVGLLTVFSMSKIWLEAFWKPHPDGDAAVGAVALTRGETVALVAPIVLLASITVIIGLAPQPFLDLAARSAQELLAPEAYVRVVLGGLP